MRKHERFLKSADHVTNYNDVLASRKDMVLKCSGLSHQTVTYLQCDQRCSLPKKCLKKKKFANKAEGKVVKIVSLFDEKVLTLFFLLVVNVKLLKIVVKRDGIKK